MHLFPLVPGLFKEEILIDILSNFEEISHACDSPDIKSIDVECLHTIRQQITSIYSVQSGESEEKFVITCIRVGG